jgi:hypothetical protein
LCLHPFTGQYNRLSFISKASMKDPYMYRRDCATDQRADFLHDLFKVHVQRITKIKLNL